MWPTLVKARGAEPPPNLADSDATRAGFSWDVARAELDGLPKGRGLNIGRGTAGRHADGARGERVALRFLRPEGEPVELTSRELRAATNRRAHVLDHLHLAGASASSRSSGACRSSTSRRPAC